MRTECEGAGEPGNAAGPARLGTAPEAEEALGAEPVEAVGGDLPAGNGERAGAERAAAAGEHGEATGRQQSGVAVAAPPGAAFTPVLLRPVPKSALVPMAAGVLPGAGLAGVASAALVPLDRPGLGWVLAGLVVAAVLVPVDRKARTSETPKRGKTTVAWAVLALLLLGVGAVRASEWLFVLCVVAAGVAGSLAVVGPRTVNSAFYDVLAVPIEAVRGVPWVARGLRGRGTQRGRVLGAVLAAGAVLVVFVPLLTSADETFAHFVEELVPDLRLDSTVRWGFLFCTGLFGTAGACYLLAGPPQRAVETPGRSTKDSLVWTVPLVTLVVLFAVYLLVRAVELFGGTSYVLHTGGLTSAEYARGGFWQLCACTVLTLGIVMAALRWAPRATPQDRLRQRILLGALAALSLVLVVSALSRMWTYQEAYGFTVLRLLVEVCEIWLGCVFLLVGAALITLRSAWLPRAAIGTAVAAVLALAVVNPEALIAGANIDRAEQGKPLDVRYLRGFSADIVPVVVERLPNAECVAGPIVLRLDDDDLVDGAGWPGWNLSRTRALDARIPPARCG
ncbi:DUF4153 domain-containing protein [Amycolatopsis sp. FDAARGOS 1241]|uniref:DUF4153 domain-containing protein n=1 Tax=Amycolatopsis sp. FDAARGOS 1241 TaxID=2778070 RepID=UPI001EF24F0D|nr:DUF4173 domain-containing protein [Amycolatopsis sp. FDAARGOS 1241]